ncbi:MAG: HAMP domain-containing sensor histidine kinase [Pseudomonadota bacterium]
MGRWSLLVRIGALLALGVFVIQLLMVAAIFADRRSDTGGGFRYPLPDQIVAMVKLAETSSDRALMLRALNSAEFSVVIQRGDFDAMTEEPIRVPRVEKVLNQYHESVGGRRLVAFIALAGDLDPIMNWRDGDIWTSHPLRMVIELKTGELLIAESRGGKLAEKVFSWPLGLFSGVISVFVALLVLWAVGRETRPLRKLSAAAVRFAETGEQRMVPEQGAPELRRLIADFNDMQARIADLLSARALMLGALGHDLRTYLTRMQLRVAALADAKLSAAMERDLTLMSQLVDDSLTLARLGIEEPDDARTDAACLLRTMTDEYIANGADIRICVERPGQSAGIAISEGMLRRLLSNLIDNALKYGTACRIDLDTSDDAVTLSVADNGPGVSQDDLDSLHRPFFRANAARTLTSDGHGLGLAIANEIALRHGGSLSFRNTEDGFTSQITLPRL